MLDPLLLEADYQKMFLFLLEIFILNLLKIISCLVLFEQRVPTPAQEYGSGNE